MHSQWSSMLVLCAWRNCGLYWVALLSALGWLLIYLSKRSNSHLLRIRNICGLISSVQHHEDNPACPKYSATHNALHSSLYWNYKTPWRERLKKTKNKTEDKKGSKSDIKMCQVVIMRSPLKHTHCGATQHSEATSQMVGSKNKLMKDWGDPQRPQLQLGDADSPASHKVHKHTGFNVSVNALPFPSLPFCTAHSPAHFQQSEILKM